MADYNIYIHSDQSNGSSSKTSAWNSDMKPSDETSSWEGKAQQVIGYAQNPDSLVSKGISTIARAIPAVAVAFAVVKLVDKVITTSNSFISTESGDYRSTTIYSNFKGLLKTTLTPFSTTINYLQGEQALRIENRSREQYRELLGDSIINSYSNYGV